jgi:hypothetical protein
MKPHPVSAQLVEALGALLGCRHYGREAATTWESLRSELAAEGLEVGVVRRLQEAAIVLRSRGLPVVGLSGSGVFVAKSVDEVDDAIGEKRRRALSALADLRAAKRIKLAMLGQGDLAGGTA